MLVATNITEDDLGHILAGDNTRNLSTLERAVAFDRKLGYSGYVCEAAPDPRTLLINLTLVPSARCEVLVIFDTDDFIILDRVKLDSYLQGHAEKAGRTLDDVFEEILEPENYDLTYIYAREIRPENIKGIFYYDILRHTNKYCYDDTDEYLSTYVRASEELIKERITKRLIGDCSQFLVPFETTGDEETDNTLREAAKDAAEYFMGCHIKTMFELCLLPAMLGTVYEGFGMKQEDLRMADMIRMKNSSVVNKIINWTLRERTSREFVMYKDMLKCYINPHLVGVTPKAKDPCPCGSGLKYKRCCGRY